jgi:PAS domain S-box-containing protein
MLDPQGRVASWNSGAQEIKGYLQAEILGEHFSCFYTAHDRENGKPQAALATAERTGRFEDDGWRLRKDGSRFWANVVVVPIRDVDGTLLGFAKVTRDNTERHHLAQLKTDFVSTLSHELRTPLTSIRGSLGLVVGSATGELPPTARRFLEIAYTNSSRLIQLVDEILDVEGIESGHVSFHREHITARDIVDQAIESNQAYAELFGVTFRVTTTPGDDGDVFGDMLRIQQVMSNLLSNAAKFSPAGSSVEVAATAERDAIRFAVRDHGAGIPIAFRHRIFQRFAQADSSDQRQKGGTGLGLSISKAIVELHGGSIGYDNLSDGGTEFWFTLARLSTAQKPTHERLSVGVR